MDLADLDWAIISGLFGGIVLLMLILYKTLRADLEMVTKQTDAFTAFRAMDAEREEHWMIWRKSLEGRMDGFEKGTREWRHEEINPSLKRIEERLNVVIETVRLLEKKMDGMPR